MKQTKGRDTKRYSKEVLFLFLYLFSVLMKKQEGESVKECVRACVRVFTHRGVCVCVCENCYSIVVCTQLQCGHLTFTFVT